jgi:hypothetical protein
MTPVETKPLKTKVGTITLALGLVALGAGMLLYNFGGIKSPETVWKMWPLLLIGLGVEYFIRRAARGDQEVEFSIPSVLLIGLFILTGTVVNALSGLGIGNILDNINLGQNHRHVREWRSEPITVAKGSGVAIESTMGAIRLEASPDEKLHVNASITGRANSESAAKTAAEAAKVIIQQGQITRIYAEKGATPSNSSISTDFEIQVPAGMTVDAGNKMGSITASRLEGNLVLKSEMGEISIEDTRGDVNTSSRMGSINIKKVTGKIDTSTDMGRVYIENPGGDVRATTRMGKIELTSATSLSNSYYLNTDNGKILFRLPGTSDLTVEADTRRGNISGLEGGVTSKSPGNSSGKLTLGSGKGTARLTAGNGQIDVDAY